MATLLQANKMRFYLKLLIKGKKASFPVFLNTFSREIERDSDTEDTLTGKVQKSGSIEESGSLEGFLSEETDFTIEDLERAIREDKQMTVWEIKYIIDEAETARALEAGEIEAGECLVPSRSYDISLTSFTALDVSAGDSASWSADYTLIAHRLKHDADGNEVKTYETFKRADVEKIETIVKEYYSIGQEAPELN